MHRRARTVRAASGLVLALTALVGCSASTGRPATVADDTAVTTSSAGSPAAAPLPPVLESLDLTAAQRVEVQRLRDRLEQRLAPAEEAARELALAVAAAAKRCDADSLAVEDASSWLVTVGDQARGAVLDGIDELHRILTPEQRRRLAEQLRRKEADGRKEDKSDDGARSLGEAIDLSLGQMIVLLARVAALRSALEDRLDPWRGEWKAALRAFPDDDFAIRDHAIAQVPAVAMAMALLRDAMRSLLPILEREQCRALGAFIEEAMRRKQTE